MRAAAVVLGVIASLILGVIVAFTLGERPAIAVFLVVLGLGVYAGAAAHPGFTRRFATLSGVTVIAGAALIAWQAMIVMDALTATAGPAEPPNSSVLVQAEAKISTVTSPGPFQVELTEAEIEALIQDGLGSDSPVRRVSATVIDGSGGGQGRLNVVAELKSGGSATVVARPEVQNGTVEVVIESVNMGILSIPGAAHGAVDELLDAVTQLNQALAMTDGTVDSVHVGNGRVLVSGTA